MDGGVTYAEDINLVIEILYKYFDKMESVSINFTCPGYHGVASDKLRTIFRSRATTHI